MVSDPDHPGDLRPEIPTPAREGRSEAPGVRDPQEVKMSVSGTTSCGGGASKHWGASSSEVVHSPTLQDV